MDDIKKFIKELKDACGEPREGFSDYFKTCKKVLLPTKVPELCSHWEVPEGIILHDIMVQPFYDSRIMKARESDILLSAYPKSGSTWTQEITYLLTHDVDFKKAKSAPIETRFPFIEIPICGIKNIDNMEDPRLIKSHVSFDLLPPSFIENKTKIIYIIRNPKDTLVSYYHFMKMLGYVGYNGTFDEYVESFCQGKMLFSSYATHVLSYWKRRNDENVLIVFYESLQKDLKCNLKKIAQFLGKSYTEEQFDQVVDHVTFDNMKKNSMANYSHGGTCVKMPDSQTDFLRKGKTGDWRNYFNDELSKKVDEYVEKHFKGSGIEFIYDI